MTRAEKLTIAQGICAPLLRKIRADLQRNAMEMEDDDEEDQTVNRLDPRLEGAIKEFQGFKALFFAFTSIYIYLDKIDLLEHFLKDFLNFIETLPKVQNRNFCRKIKVSLKARTSLIAPSTQDTRRGYYLLVDMYEQDCILHPKAIFTLY